MKLTAVTPYAILFILMGCAEDNSPSPAISQPYPDSQLSKDTSGAIIVDRFPRPQRSKWRDVSVARRAPGQLDFVISPHTSQLVDVTEFAPYSVVKDPTTADHYDSMLLIRVPSKEPNKTQQAKPR